MKEQDGRISSLDGLRAMSIVMVVIGHAMGMAHGRAASAPGLPYQLFSKLGVYATFGVTVFFVISGFLITTLLLKEREETGTISLKNFYVRRAYRILPASYAAILLIAIICRAHVHIIDVVSSTFYVANFVPHPRWPLAHMWSLSVEEQFYLLWPFLLKGQFRNRYKFLAIAIVLAPFFRLAFAAAGNHQAQAEWFPSVQDTLATGCLLALFRERLSHITHILDKFFAPVAIFTLLLPLLSYPRGVEPLVVLTLTNFGIAFCIENCIRKKYWILNWKPVVWLGTLSYSIYLFQMPFFTPGSSSWLTRFPANVLFILPVAMACHYFIEKPFLKLRARRAARTQVPVPVT